MSKKKESKIDAKGVLMEWVQFIIFFIGVFGLWLWNRAESRSDYRHTDAKLENHRAEMTQILKAISDEMKDFHGRLERQDAEFRTRFLALEERKIKILEK